MRSLRRPLLVIALIAMALPVSATEIPFLTGRVTDNAEILNPATRDTLTARLQAHEQSSGNQIAVLTIRSLGSDSIEEYATAVFAAWKLGQKGRDNGVLVVVAPQERRMRIEVGYGLEGTLTDILTGRIIRDYMTPRFAANDYNGGVNAGINAVLQVLEKGALAEAESVSETQPAAKKDFFQGPDLPLTERILFGAFIFGIIGLFTVVGVLTPGMGWFLYFFLIPFWAMFPIIIVGVQGALTLLATYLVGFPVAKIIVSKKAWYAKARQDLRNKGRAQIGGFTVTSGGHSSGSSWSSGGSSFSGGGGSSGGGGASGSW